MANLLELFSSVPSTAATKLGQSKSAVKLDAATAIMLRNSKLEELK